MTATSHAESTWFGSAPRNWKVMKLKHLARYESGEGITSLTISDEGEFPVYGGNGLRGYTDAYVYDGEFILIGRQGALCGNINYAQGKFWASEHAVVVKPRSKVVLRWLGELLRAMDLLQYSQSAAQPGLSVEYIINLHVPVPPPELQQVIADFLDRKTAQIDGVIAKKQRMIDLLHEKRQALISEAVTKGLDPDVPTKDSGIEWLGRVPSHWSVERLKWRMRSIEQGWSPQCENRQADPGEWGVLKVGCMNSGIYDESENKALPADLEPLPEFEVRVGDILMSRSNTVELVGCVGRVHRTQGKIHVCDKLYRLIFYDDRLDADFAVLLLRSHLSRLQIERDASGASPSMKNISNEVVAELVLAFPPLNEQRRIIKHVGQLLDELRRLGALMEEQITKLREYRQTLISAAVTGQIDVSKDVA